MEWGRQGWSVVGCGRWEKSGVGWDKMRLVRVVVEG